MEKKHIIPRLLNLICLSKIPDFFSSRHFLRVGGLERLRDPPRRVDWLVGSSLNALLVQHDGESKERRSWEGSREEWIPHQGFQASNELWIIDVHFNFSVGREDKVVAQAVFRPQVRSSLILEVTGTSYCQTDKIVQTPNTLPTYSMHYHYHILLSQKLEKRILCNTAGYHRCKQCKQATNAMNQLGWPTKDHNHLIDLDQSPC